MRISWMPHGQNFFDMFDEAAELISRAADGFVALVQHMDNTERRVNELGELAERCHRSVERILSTPVCTFSTPLDRKDIRALARSLADVLDQIVEAAFRLAAFAIDQPPPATLKLALIIHRFCSHLQQAIHLCRGNLAVEAIADALREVDRLGDEADEVYRQAEVGLFAGPPEIMALVKHRELYVRLKRTVDACGNVANAIKEIVVKER